MFVSLLFQLALFAASAAPAAGSQPEAVELRCKPPTDKGRLEDCRVVADRCEGAGYARRALIMARAARVEPSDYPGDEPVQVFIPCRQISPQGLSPYGPGFPDKSAEAARRRQFCEGNPNNPC